MVSDRFQWGNSFNDTSFSRLMQKRIGKILIICSDYDFYTLEEDGRIDEKIFNEYVSLNLRYPPIFIHTASSQKAFEWLKSDDIDLVIEMLSIDEHGSFELAKQIKSSHPEIPIVVLTPFSRKISKFLENEDTSAIDYIFCWLGNTDLLIAIIKLIEDKMNAENDILEVGVQAILLIEDSIRYISSYLPHLYRIILEQSQSFSKEALNEHQQMLRRRGRPKVLVAKNMREADLLFEKYKHGHLLGIISDVSYKTAPDKRDTKSKSGLRFCKKAKAFDPNIPFLLQSSDSSNAEKACHINAGFLYKYSKNISNELRDYMLHNFGFGDFVFFWPKTQEEYTRVRNLKMLQEKILEIPDEIIEFHTRHDDFSKWLNARALFPLAKYLKNYTLHDFKTDDEIKHFIHDTIVYFRGVKARGVIAEFDKDNIDEFLYFARIGTGNMGGKARGLAFMNTLLKNAELENKYKNVAISIPSSVVLCTGVFEDFMDRNDLYKLALSDSKDEDILKAFVKAHLSEHVMEQLKALVASAKKPLAIRSSSKLEDSYIYPFAGVYNTYMIPVCKDKARMLELLSMAIKSVYASVFFQGSKSYIRSTSNYIDEEKMAVVIQSICGKDYDGKYYPTISGVAKSINYYPIGKEKKEEGVVNIVYGLGKELVEGGVSLRFSPEYPQKALQLSTVSSALKETQKKFYALSMDPERFVASIEDGINLDHYSISEAENDDSLQFAASVYDMQNQVIRDGTFYEGKKIITFSNILKHDGFPLASIIKDILDLAKKALNNHVEIEFAINMDVPDGEPIKFNLLQMRQVVTNFSAQRIDINDYLEDNILIYTDNSLGNGVINGVKDVIIVKENFFGKENNRVISKEIAQINRRFNEDGGAYLLIGPGRWGSADPCLGIPVKWQEISNAMVIVETVANSRSIEPSQGTHFFHNITNLGIGYLTVDGSKKGMIMNKSVLKKEVLVEEYEFLEHYRFKKELAIVFDGMSSRGIIAIE